MKYEPLTQERVFDKISFARILNVHEKNEEGETPLHIASNEGQIELVASLIERGAELDTSRCQYKYPKYLWKYTSSLRCCARKYGSREITDRIRC